MSAVAIPIKQVEYEQPDGQTCDTKFAWARVPAEPSPAERSALKDKIKRLLKERNAVMVSHYYVHPDLQDLAEETGIAITVCHLPPGTSKWNKIEHRLFSAISAHWRGRPLESHEVVIETIRAVTTTTG